MGPKVTMVRPEVMGLHRLYHPVNPPRRGSNKLKQMKNAIQDIFYMIGLWIIIRLNPIGGGELLEKWGEVLQGRGKSLK